MDKQELEKYAKGRRIRFIVLFGSRTDDTAKDASDFDVAVYLDKNRRLFSNSKLYSDLLDYISQTFDFHRDKIDLTDLNQADILLRYEITSKGKLLYGDEEQYLEYKLFALKDYLDSQSLRDLETFLIRKRQKELSNILKK